MRGRMPCRCSRLRSTSPKPLSTTSGPPGKDTLAGPLEDAGWDYGTDLAYLKRLVAYWRHDFDWRAQEAALNRFAQYRADVDGVGLHFIHERGHGTRPLPLIITHGWPSSFAQMRRSSRRSSIRRATVVTPPIHSM